MAVGKWEGWVCLSTFPLLVAAAGMWESRSDFQRLGARRETCFWFSSASTVRHFRRRLHAVLFCRKSANNFCLAACMACAASVSLCASATACNRSIVIPGFR